MTTILGFLQGLAALDVDGVRRKYQNKPASVQTADLPCSFVELPDADQNRATAWGSANSSTSLVISGDLIIAIEPAGQGTPSENTIETATLADAVKDALEASDLMPLIEYRIETSKANVPIFIGQQSYWGVRVMVTGRGG